MKKTALITGASSGIGYELSTVFAKNGYDLVLVSRTAAKLETLADTLQQHDGMRAWVIPKDLSGARAARELYADVSNRGIRVDVLVNNAGIATHGRFVDTDLGQHTDLIQLNMTSLTLLCRQFGADMVRRGSGRILNVASTAAFQAGPFMSTYYASKAYVLMLSEGLHHELKRDGVVVTVLCPGPTRTEFFERNDLAGTRLEKSPHMMRAARVAELGYAGLMAGKTIVIPGLINKLLALSVRLTPRVAAAAVTTLLHRK